MKILYNITVFLSLIKVNMSEICVGERVGYLYTVDINYSWANLKFLLLIPL